MSDSSISGAYFLDSSALVKLIRTEPGSAPLRALTSTAERFISDLAIVELRRFARRMSPNPEAILPRIEHLISACEVIFMDSVVLATAGDIEHRDLGTLDAIHLATALRAAPLDGFITYDRRQARAAGQSGLTVFSPE